MTSSAVERSAADRAATVRERGRAPSSLLAFTATALAAIWSHRAPAQETQPTAPEPPPGLSAHVAHALGEIRDFAFNFDYEGFYLLVEHVRDESEPPREIVQPIDDWRVLLERPSEFRGRWVEVEGIVGRNRGYTITRPGGRGAPVWQIELGGTAEQPIACTVVLTRPADDVPLGATMRVAGRFVMIRQYFDSGNRPQPAALIVARGPTMLSQPAATPRRAPRANWTWLVGGLAVGLLVAWFLLRRVMADRPRSDPRTLHASRAAPINLSQDLATWAQRPQAPPSAETAHELPPEEPPERTPTP